MKNNRTNYTLLGSFILLSLVSLLGALYVLGNRQGPSATYYTYLDRVAGIKFGTPVTYAGYAVGQVNEVTPQQDEHGTRYRLALAVREDWRIPADSVARVVADGLLSAVSIDIEEGRAREPLAAGAELRGVAGANVFAAMNAVAGEFESLSRQTLRPMLQRLNGSVEVFATAMEQTAPALLSNLETVSTGLGATLPDGLQNLHRLSARLDSQVPRILDDLQIVSASLRQATPQIAGTLSQSAKRVDAMLSDRNVQRVDAILANLDNASGDLGTLLGRLDGAAVAVNDVIGDVDRMMQRAHPELDASLRSLRDTLSRVSDTVEVVSHHVEGGSRNLQEFSRRIRDNPSALLLSSSPEEVSRP